MRERVSFIWLILQAVFMACNYLPVVSLVCCQVSTWQEAGPIADGICIWMIPCLKQQQACLTSRAIGHPSAVPVFEHTVRRSVLLQLGMQIKLILLKIHLTSWQDARKERAAYGENTLSLTQRAHYDDPRSPFLTLYTSIDSTPDQLQTSHQRTHDHDHRFKAKPSNNEDKKKPQSLHGI